VTRQREVLQVAVICTGNQFRSPIVEGLMRVSASDLPVYVASFGTEKLGPARALPEAIRHASRFGIDLKDHRAQALHGVDLSVADLVIGFELAHVAAAVVEAGAPYEKTFTILELVALLDDVDQELPEDPVRRAREAVIAAHRLRSNDGGYYPQHQLRDPVGGSDEVFETTAEELRASTRKLVERLFGVTPQELPPIE
jgi:protein-tyrosine-phosphatase